MIKVNIIDIGSELITYNKLIERLLLGDFPFRNIGVCWNLYKQLI